jgi:hypothetical protein
MVSLKLAPFDTTLFKVSADKTNDKNTPNIVTEWAMRRPMTLPPNLVPNTPATKAPINGAVAVKTNVEAERVCAIF